MRSKRSSKHKAKRRPFVLISGYLTIVMAAGIHTVPTYSLFEASTFSSVPMRAAASFCGRSVTNNVYSPYSVTDSVYGSADSNYSVTDSVYGSVAADPPESSVFSNEYGSSENNSVTASVYSNQENTGSANVYRAPNVCSEVTNDNTVTAGVYNASDLPNDSGTSSVTTSVYGVLNEIIAPPNSTVTTSVYGKPN
ncbi:hypothetical protein J31TS4_33990 [Paenibacillus sp. J31TS4]|nr:hypothetical protein J31TS4_33990 [Paenibacillus sp. J31TS4]